MKTAREVIDRAMSLLGYTDNYGGVDTSQYVSTYKKSMPIINTVYMDLKRLEDKSNTLDKTEITDLDGEIPLSFDSINDCMVYGVAMYLAQTESDGDNQAMFSNIYTQKRKGIPRKSKTVTNVHDLRWRG